MPSPIQQNKFKEQVENNIYLRQKMQDAFIQANDALSNTSLGSLDRFDVVIDGINFRHRPNDAIYINDQFFSDCTPILKQQAYDRLDRFMKIAIEKYNIQFNI